MPGTCGRNRPWKRVFADAVKDTETSSCCIRVAQSPMTSVPVTEGRDTDTEETPHGDTGRHWRDAAAGQGTPEGKTPEGAEGPPLGPVRTSVSDSGLHSSEGTGRDGWSSAVCGPVPPWPRVPEHGSGDPWRSPWPSRQAGAGEGPGPFPNVNTGPAVPTAALRAPSSSSPDPTQM